MGARAVLPTLPLILLDSLHQPQYVAWRHPRKPQVALLPLLRGCPAHPPDTGGWGGRWLLLLIFDAFPECPHPEPTPSAVISPGPVPVPNPTHLEMKSVQGTHSNRQSIPQRGTMKLRRFRDARCVTLAHSSSLPIEVQLHDKEVRGGRPSMLCQRDRAEAWAQGPGSTWQRVRRCRGSWPRCMSLLCVLACMCMCLGIYTCVFMCVYTCTCMRCVIEAVSVCALHACNICTVHVHV